MINSPLNYAGNKFKVLKEIIPLFPKKIDIIVEVFAGSALLSLNSSAKKIILNDNSETTIKLLDYFNKRNGNDIIDDIEAIIKRYGFTDTHHMGKKMYVEVNHEGLSKYNKEPFEKLKFDYNNKPSIDKLFALIIYGFNHYIRFNSSGKFNVPVGKVDYSTSLRAKTIEYSNSFKTKRVEFLNYDFRNPKLYEAGGRDALYYFDPPYLITNAPYNSNWGLKEEKDLLLLLDELNDKKIKFALSNVLISNGKENILLKEWSKKYKVHTLRRQYRNANYRRKNITETMEVLITNY